MHVMLDYFLRRWGEAAQIHGDTSANGPCLKCGDTSSGWHKSDRFVIWTDKTDGLGKTCTEHGITGACWCRQCGCGGDTIWYLMEIEGMSFDEACEACGIRRDKAAEARRARRPLVHAPAPEPAPRAFEGRPASEPSEAWREHAARLDAEARAALHACRSALAWLLRKHGISAAMAERYGLGLLLGEAGKPFRFRPRSSFGLEPKTNQATGRTVTRICIPRGVTIASRDVAGELTQFRIRRPAGDIEPGRPKYHELEGGAQVPHVIAPAAPASVKVWIVVEGELDAMLLHAVAGGGVGAVAMRSCTKKPDAATHRLLAGADLILVTLDSDEAGRNGTAWWLKTYPQAKNFPVPGFKDPGDAFEAGFGLRAWLEAGMPRSVRLAPSFAPSGPEDGQCAPSSPAPAAPASAAEPPAPRAAAPCAARADASGPVPAPVHAESAQRPARSTDCAPKTPARAACAPSSPVSRPSAAEPAEPCAPTSSVRGSHGGAGERSDAVEAVMAMAAGRGRRVPDAPASAEASDDRGGADGAPQAAAPFPPAVMHGLRECLPSYLVLDAVPHDVLRLAMLWRGTPVRYRRLPGGFEWDIPNSWRRAHGRDCEAFMRLATESRDVADWLSAHVAAEIWSGNFLEVFGPAEDGGDGDDF